MAANETGKRPVGLVAVAPGAAAIDAPTVAVVLPCYNEAVTIGEVVADFRKALPDAEIHVFDNNSTDATAERARAAGARVRAEAMQGKGNVVRRMFADIEADIYVMADGDGTYDIEAAPALVERLATENLDMVVGARLGAHDDGAFRGGHKAGKARRRRMMVEFDRDHGPGDVAQLRGFKPVVPAPGAGAFKRDQGRVLLERPDQGRFDPIGMEGGVNRQHGAGQGRQRQPLRPVVGPVHGIEDETMPRRAGTDFQWPALFGIDDDRQLEFPDDSQSRVVGD